MERVSNLLTGIPAALSTIFYHLKCSDHAEEKCEHKNTFSWAWCFIPFIINNVVMECWSESFIIPLRYVINATDTWRSHSKQHHNSLHTLYSSTQHPFHSMSHDPTVHSYYPKETKQVLDDWEKTVKLLIKLDPGFASWNRQHGVRLAGRSAGRCPSVHPSYVGHNEQTFQPNFETIQTTITGSQQKNGTVQ